MIEEAAGTRMYEAKKQSAVRTIEKKEGKMAEIKQVSFMSIAFYLLRNSISYFSSL